MFVTETEANGPDSISVHHMNQLAAGCPVRILYSDQGFREKMCCVHI